MGTNEDWEKLINKYKGKRLTRGRAINLYCKLECCAGDTESWRNCSIPNCFLWRYRKGGEVIEGTKSKKKTNTTLSNSKEKEVSEE